MNHQLAVAAFVDNRQHRVGGTSFQRAAWSNDGNAHVQVTHLRLEAPPGQELDRQQSSVYVLPGQSREWRLKGTAMPGSALRVFARTDGGEVHTDLKVEER